jgi:hypothetical protein
VVFFCPFVRIVALAEPKRQSGVPVLRHVHTFAVIASEAWQSSKNQRPKVKNQNDI